MVDTPEKSFWQLVPWRNLRRALLLLAALGAIVGLKRCVPGSVRSAVESYDVRLKMTPRDAASERR